MALLLPPADDGVITDRGSVAGAVLEGKPLEEAQNPGTFGAGSERASLESLVEVLRWRLRRNHGAPHLGRIRRAKTLTW